MPDKPNQAGNRIVDVVKLKIMIFSTATWLEPCIHLETPYLWVPRYLNLVHYCTLGNLAGIWDHTYAPVSPMVAVCVRILRRSVDSFHAFLASAVPCAVQSTKLKTHSWNQWLFLATSIWYAGRVLGLLHSCLMFLVIVPDLLCRMHSLAGNWWTVKCTMSVLCLRKVLA